LQEGYKGLLADVNVATMDGWIVGCP
jgi:hypothetical protein